MKLNEILSEKQKENLNTARLAAKRNKQFQTWYEKELGLSTSFGEYYDHLLNYGRNSKDLAFYEISPSPCIPYFPKFMNINEYQSKAIETAIYGAGHKIVYPTLGLVGEAGEIANKVKKVLRDNDGVFSDEIKKELSKELGDVLWYIAALANDLGFTLGEVARENIEKLQSRKERNVISGSGDNR